MYSPSLVFQFIEIQQNFELIYTVHTHRHWHKYLVHGLIQDDRVVETPYNRLWKTIFLGVPSRPAALVRHLGNTFTILGSYSILCPG